MTLCGRLPSPQTPGRVVSPEDIPLLVTFSLHWLERWLFRLMMLQLAARWPSRAMAVSRGRRRLFFLCSAVLFFHPAAHGDPEERSQRGPGLCAGRWEQGAPVRASATVRPAHWALGRPTCSLKLIFFKAASDRLPPSERSSRPGGRSTHTPQLQVQQDQGRCLSAPT